MIWNALLLALREIRNNLLRASLTTLGIVIGVSAVILMVTLGSGANRKVTGEFASLGNNLLAIIPGQQNGPPTAVTPFDMSIVDKIQREIPDLSQVVPELAEQAAVRRAAAEVDVLAGVDDQAVPVERAGRAAEPGPGLEQRDRGARFGERDSGGDPGQSAADHHDPWAHPSLPASALTATRAFSPADSDIRPRSTAAGCSAMRSSSRR